MNIRYIDFDNSNTYTIDNKYVFWFNDEQSTGLVYSKKIGFICDELNVNISINNDSIFKLLNIQYKSSNSNDWDYQDIDTLQTTNYISQGTFVDGKYIHIIYICASSDVGGEYKDVITIGDDENINIGANFFDVDEELYINLSNMGVEIPSEIQKTLYNTNIHESNRDNILINRKFKELIINYWDVIANKGSYNSLVNALKWFEWGDNIEMREMFEYNINNRTLYSEYNNTYDNYKKTTYISLNYCLKQIDGDKCDENGNPILIDKFDNNINNITNMISKNDMLIKMSLLGLFYKTYFMPIHMNLYKSTVEDVIYTHNKSISFGTANNRTDNIYNGFNNIFIDNDIIDIGYRDDEERPIIYLEAVHFDSDKHLIFKEKQDDGGNITYKDINNDNKSILNRYSGIGCILPMYISLKSNKTNTFINETIRLYNKTTKNIYKYTFDNVFIKEPIDGYVTIYFDMLISEPGDYQITMGLLSDTGDTYIKTIDIAAIESYTYDIGVYKVLPRTSLASSMITNNDIRYSLGLYGGDNDILTQYLPVYNKSDKSIKLNRVIVTNSEIDEDIDGYFKFNIQEKTILISKNFINDITLDLPESVSDVIINKLAYFPCFHYYKELGGDMLNDYVINQYDTVIVKTPILTSKKIDESVWKFTNVTTNEVIEIKNNAEPYINNLFAEPISDGFYDIDFTYKIGNEPHTISKSSMFLKISI